MSRNRMAGNHPSYDKKGMNAADIEKKKAYDSKYQKTRSRVKYRVELNRKNKEAGTYGNGDGMDMSHTKKGTMVKESQKTNRGRNGHGKNRSRLK
jgi:hypothetical protein